MFMGGGLVFLGFFFLYRFANLSSLCMIDSVMVNWRNENILLREHIELSLFTFSHLYRSDGEPSINIVE